MSELTNVIAIDGPSGSGKSSVTKEVAKRLNLFHINTGALFRAVAVYWAKFEETLDLNIEYQDHPFKVSINNKDLTNDLYNHEYSDKTSKISTLPALRSLIEEAEKQLVNNSDRLSILEGRDIGTVIFPNAKFKFFLTASAEKRGQRRYKQLLEQNKLEGLSLEEIIEDIKKRDKRDSSREIAPLKASEDAIVIDSSNLSPEEVVAIIINTIEKK